VKDNLLEALICFGPQNVMELREKLALRGEKVSELQVVERIKQNLKLKKIRLATGFEIPAYMIDSGECGRYLEQARGDHTR